MRKPKRTADVRAPLSRERIVQTAIALADAGGLESLTMRRLGDELGTSAMALYYYVPSKEDLVDAMVDVVFGEIEVPTTDVDWRTAMRRRAHSTRAALRRHRWAVGYMEGRATPGPANLRLHDAVLGCLREAGFSIAATVDAYSVQDAYIYGFALQERSLPFEDAEGGAAVAEAQFREYDALEAERQLGELAESFPYLAEVVVGHVARVGYDFDAAFRDGLDLILDALEARRVARG
jgi:AcrR family transcriptional regulator